MSRKKAVFIREEIGASYAESYLQRKGFEVDRRIEITEGDMRNLPSSGIDLVVLDPVGSTEYSAMAMRLVRALRPDYGSPSPIELVIWTAHHPQDGGNIGEMLTEMKLRGAQVKDSRLPVIFYQTIDKLCEK